MSSNYFYTSKVEQGRCYLDADESRHMTKSFRLQVGDEFHAVDGLGGRFTCQLEKIDMDGCVGTVLHSSLQSLPALQLHLAVAPTKNLSRIEQMLEKCTEFGISEFTPIVCVRSIKRNVKIERLQRIALGAMKQSQRSFLPKIHRPCDLAQFVNQGSGSHRYIAHLNNGESPELLTRAIPESGKITLMIGPEGDFTNEEVKLARENGWSAVSLGPTRLRTETAGIYAAAVVYERNSYSHF